MCLCITKVSPKSFIFARTTIRLSQTDCFTTALPQLLLCYNCLNSTALLLPTTITYYFLHTGIDPKTGNQFNNIVRECSKSNSTGCTTKKRTSLTAKICFCKGALCIVERTFLLVKILTNSLFFSRRWV